MFKEPKTEYSNYYDQARFRLTWRTCLSIFISMVIFALSMGVTSPQFMPPTLIALVVSFVLLWVLRQSKKYEFSAKSFVFLGTLLSISQLFLVNEVLHLVDFMWFFVITLFAYFTLGKIWGNITLIILISSISVFISLTLNKNIDIVQFLDAPAKASMIINTILAGSILGYIVNQFINTSGHAEAKFNLSNSMLKDQNIIIQNQNEQNIIMLKEIHHRVKNNLQVITSMLRLQSRDFENTDTKDQYLDAINRIATMALIHEKMYRNDLSKLDLNNYFISLSEDLKQSYSSDSFTTNFTIDIAVTSVGLKTIVPLALIYNELVSNSLKHAFSDMNSGTISFIGKQNENGLILIEYFDNGKWKESDKINSFGLELIDTFVEQLEGSYQKNTQNGTHYYFELHNID